MKRIEPAAACPRRRSNARSASSISRQRRGRKFRLDLLAQGSPSSPVSCEARSLEPRIVADEQQAARRRRRLADEVEQRRRTRQDRCARSKIGRQRRPAVRASSSVSTTRTRRARRAPGRSAARGRRISPAHRAAPRAPALVQRPVEIARDRRRPSSDLAWRSRVRVFMRPSPAGRQRRPAPESLAATRSIASSSGTRANRARRAGRRSAAATASPPTGGRTCPRSPSRRISRPNACASRARTTRSS